MIQGVHTLHIQISVYCSIPLENETVNIERNLEFGLKSYFISKESAQIVTRNFRYVIRQGFHGNNFARKSFLFFKKELYLTFFFLHLFFLSYQWL